LAIGLSLTGLALLVAPSLGQLQREQDAAVRKTGTASTSAGPRTPVAPVIGTIDLDSVFKNYKKFQISRKEFQSAMQVRKGDLMKIEAEARQEAEMMAKLTPGTEDFRKRENKLTELKAKFEAGKEQAEREFQLREAESWATLYKEVQTMVSRVAQWRGMNYIVRVSNQPISGTDPNSVMAAISSTMVYADPRNDITADVTHNLNKVYEATAGPSTKPAARNTGAVSPGAMAQPNQ